MPLEILALNTMETTIRVFITSKKNRKTDKEAKTNKMSTTTKLLLGNRLLFEWQVILVVPSLLAETLVQMSAYTTEL